MTEAEWMACIDLGSMLTFLCERPEVRRRKAGRRKLRLWGCACCRFVWDELTDQRSRKAVDVSDRLADGRIPHAEVEAVMRDAEAVLLEMQPKGFYEPGMRRAAAQGAADLLGSSWSTFALAGYVVARGGHHFLPGEPAPAWPYAEFLRDVFGNPFRSVVPIDRSWQTWDGSTVPKLAETIYADRSFADLPILADALEDAGCTNADILNHCRQPGEHVRGCWVVDLLVGKE